MNTIIYPERYKNIESVNNLCTGWDSVVKAIRDDYQADPILVKAKAAIDAGLNDSAINYFWNLTMYDLYRKIIAYGIDYFKSAINWSGAPLKTIDNLREVKDYLPRFLVERAQFLPKLLVLGCILDNFTCFLPRLLDIIYNFAPTRHKKGMIWHITRDILTNSSLNGKILHVVNRF